MVAAASDLDVAPEIAKGVTPPSPRRRTLLIVDDEDGPRQSLRVVFKKEYDLLLATNGREAVEIAAKTKVDAAILDIRMVGMSGIETLQGLKAVDAGIEVIMLTAYESIDTVRQALRLGACDYLNKPFDIPTIRAAVSNAMERRGLSFEVKANSDKLRILQDELQNQKLEEAMVRSRGEIYASIIHDINGPLTIISGFLQLINQRIGEDQKVEGQDLEMVKDRLRRITKQVTNCIDISRRYLSFLRQNPGEMMRVSVNQTLTDLQELMRVHPSVKTNVLSVTPLAEDVTVQIHGTDFIQLIRNLTVNALQCTTESHHVDVIAEIVNEALPEFEESCEHRFIHGGNFANKAPLLAIAVRDNGPGISPENTRRLFCESFTTQATGKGTGLGLSIVKRLATRAGGAIRVQTQPGDGTCFTVYLPLE
jgi:two-component system, sensor histidine kinase and response regulator